MPSSPPFPFTATATTTIYTLSLHDALPISQTGRAAPPACSRSTRYLDRRGRLLASIGHEVNVQQSAARHARDRKSTRLNSSHVAISYAVFCLKKKKKK